MAIRAPVVAEEEVVVATAREFWKTLKSFRGKTKTNGLTGKDCRYYEKDFTHGDIEVYGSRGNHTGRPTLSLGK